MSVFGLQQQYGELSRLVSSGQYPAALALAERLHKAAPRDANVLVLLAHAQRGMGRIKEALLALEKAEALAPGHPSIANPRGMLLMRAGRFAEAKALYERAIAKHPGDVGLRAAAAQVFSLAGEHDRAWETLASSADAAGASLPPIATLTLAKVARLASADETTRATRMRQSVDRLRHMLDQGGASLAPVHRTAALFELGTLHEALGEFDEAFEAYASGNASRRVVFDPAENARRFDAIKRVFSCEALATLPRASVKADRAVLIVGMPRSATSLVEQMLASHPRAAGGDELPDLSRIVHTLEPSPSHLMPMVTRPESITLAALETHARAYLDTLRRVSPTAQRVTDKTPANFLHLGLAQVMLPRVRVVHCRRDPIDTCLSCYFQNFAGNNPYAYDLRHLGMFYRAYESLMEHWRGALDAPMHEVVYERLVAEPEAQARALAEFLDLGWDERVLRFHENPRVLQSASNDQVRRPLFKTSIARWKRYERHLGPLLEALGP